MFVDDAADILGRSETKMNLVTDINLFPSRLNHTSISRSENTSEVGYFVLKKDHWA